MKFEFFLCHPGPPFSVIPAQGRDDKSFMDVSTSSGRINSCEKIQYDPNWRQASASFFGPLHRYLLPISQLIFMNTSQSFETPTVFQALGLASPICRRNSTGTKFYEQRCQAVMSTSLGAFHSRGIWEGATGDCANYCVGLQVL